MTPPVNESSGRDQQAFSSFYDRYAPKLWGLILLADLSIAQSETILMETLTKVWHQIEQPTEEQILTRLIGLACKAGLPVECLKNALKRIK